MKNTTKLIIIVLTAMLMLSGIATANMSPGTTISQLSEADTLSITAPSDINIEATGALTVVDIGTATSMGGVSPISITSTTVASYPVGVTLVTWKAEDSASPPNVESATQMITVTDTTAPTIDLGGVTEATLERYDIYTDAPVTATDLVDGVVTVTPDFLINPANVGDHVITYTATDSHGNTATATRTVHTVDTHAPADINPVSVVVGTVTTNSISLSWTNPTDPDFQRVVITVSTGGVTLTGKNKLDLPNGNAFVEITGLLPDTTYTILLQTADDREPTHIGNGT